MHRLSLSHTIGFKLKIVPSRSISPNHASPLNQSPSNGAHIEVRNAFSVKSATLNLEGSPIMDSPNHHRKNSSQQFIRLGSASPTALKNSSPLLKSNVAERMKLSLLPTYNPPVVTDPLEFFLINNMRRDPKTAPQDITKSFKKSRSQAASVVMENQKAAISAALDNYDRISTPQTKPNPIRLASRSGNDFSRHAWNNRTKDLTRDELQFQHESPSVKAFRIKRVEAYKQDSNVSYYSSVRSPKNDKIETLLLNQVYFNSKASQQAQEHTMMPDETLKNIKSAEERIVKGMNEVDDKSKTVLKRLLTTDEQLLGGVRLYVRSITRKGRRPRGELSPDTGYTLQDRQRVITASRKTRSNKQSLDINALKCFNEIKISGRLTSGKKVTNISTMLERKRSIKIDQDRLEGIKDICKGVTGYGDGPMIEGL